MTLSMNLQIINHCVGTNPNCRLREPILFVVIKVFIFYENLWCWSKSKAFHPASRTMYYKKILESKGYEIFCILLTEEFQLNEQLTAAFRHTSLIFLYISSESWIVHEVLTQGFLSFHSTSKKDYILNTRPLDSLQFETKLITHFIITVYLLFFPPLFPGIFIYCGQMLAR